MQLLPTRRELSSPGSRHSVPHRICITTLCLVQLIVTASDSFDTEAGLKSMDAAEQHIELPGSPASTAAGRVVALVTGADLNFHRGFTGFSPDGISGECMISACSANSHDGVAKRHRF